MNTGQYLFQRFAGWFSPYFSTKNNPLYHLADISIFMLAVASISGVYIFLFYNVDPAHSYDSIERLSNQWVGGLMRSIHRYSSDLLVVFVLMHLAHMYITGKFRRILSWITGVGSFLVVVFVGVTGYLLVWDEKSKLLGTLTAKFLAAIPIFDPSISGAFLLNDLPSVGGFFRVALFGHIFFTLFIVIILWLHVSPIARPKLIPPKQAMLYTSAALVLLSLVFPVKSDPPAGAVILPTNTTFDWFFCFGYFFMKILSPAGNWLLMLGSGIFLSMLPYMSKKNPMPQPVVDLDTCDGCDQCAKDCPYGALDLLPQMGEPYNGELKAILNPSKCVGCSICVASCHVDAITIASLPPILQQATPGAPKKKLTVYQCKYAGVEDTFQEQAVKVPCIGGIHPKTIRDQLEHHAEGVALVGCEDCFYRFGKDFEEMRLNRKRRPTLFRRTPLQRVRMIALTDSVGKELDLFRKELQTVDDKKVQNKLKVVERNTYYPLVAAIVTFLFFMLIPFVSNSNFTFYRPDEKMLILNFRYVSSPTAYQELHSGPAHMQSTEPIVKSRSGIIVRVEDMEGKTIFEKEFEPRGLRKDIAIFVFAEIKTEAPRANVKITETAFPEKSVSLQGVKLNDSNGTVIIFKDGQLQKMR